MSVRWGSQTKRYVPGCSVIVRDFLPTKSTVGGAPFAVGWLTPGIVYSLPMLAIGIYLWRTARERQAA